MHPILNLRKISRVDNTFVITEDKFKYIPHIEVPLNIVNMEVSHDV